MIIVNVLIFKTIVNMKTITENEYSIILNELIPWFLYERLHSYIGIYKICITYKLDWNNPNLVKLFVIISNTHNCHFPEFKYMAGGPYKLSLCNQFKYGKHQQILEFEMLKKDIDSPKELLKTFTKMFTIFTLCNTLEKCK